jgi:hypothetical protein
LVTSGISVKEKEKEEKGEESWSPPGMKASSIFGAF